MFELQDRAASRIQSLARGRQIRESHVGKAVAARHNALRTRRRVEAETRQRNMERALEKERAVSTTEMSPHQKCMAIVKAVVFVIVGIPAVVITIAMLMGGMLAGAEGWPLKEGFYYVIGNLVCLATPLTDVSPEDGGGKVLDILVSVWALSLAGVAIGSIAQFYGVGRLVDAVEGRTYTDETENRIVVDYCKLEIRDLQEDCMKLLQQIDATVKRVNTSSRTQRTPGELLRLLVIPKHRHRLMKHVKAALEQSHNMAISNQKLQDLVTDV